MYNVEEGNEAKISRFEKKYLSENNNVVDVNAIRVTQFKVLPVDFDARQKTSYDISVETFEVKDGLYTDGSKCLYKKGFSSEGTTLKYTGLILEDLRELIDGVLISIEVIDYTIKA